MLKHVGSAGVAMDAKQERIKRVYPLLMRNRNRFKSFYLSMYQSAWHRETKNHQKIQKEN